MAENPLLPHRRLQELHALMLRCHDLEQQNRFAPALSREALLSPPAIQAEPGDVLFGEPGDTTVDQILAKPSSRKKTATDSPQPKVPPQSHLLLGAGIARGLQAAGKGICFAFTSAGIRDESWPQAFTYAQTARLPLIVLCADSGPAAKSSAATSLGEATKVCKGLHLPLLTVDGEDAIAVYRVVQESIHRARHHDGPAIVWCFLNRQRGAKQAASKPIAHMEQYLAARKLNPLKRR